MLSAVLSLCLALPQGGAETPPTGLTIVMVDVDQGSSTVIQAPDGTVHLIDGGLTGMGLSAVDPVVRSLSPTGYGYTIATHYHTDHIGGLDELLNAYPFQVAFDRGDESPWSSSAMQEYLVAAGSRRQTPVVGQTLQLGGGAVLRFLALNGEVLGGTKVSVRGRIGEENARSIAMRVEYGDFSLWVGGDLTGGYLSEPDVETPTALACGDVDVYIANHHGSRWSTNANLVARLRPELALASAGIGNGVGAPSVAVINRLNSASASIPMLATTVGSRMKGFSVCGTVTITTDGSRYRATAANGGFFDFAVDEAATLPPGPGDIRISEIQRLPGSSKAYLEIVNIGARPCSLRDVRVSAQTGGYLFGSSALLIPGRPVMLQQDGYPVLNGGLPLGMVWPNQAAFSLGGVSDNLQLSVGSTTLDAVSYGSGFAGGAGAAAERVDLLGSSVGANFAAATVAYSSGLSGTPAASNSVDASSFPARLEVEVSPGRFTLHGASLSHGGMADVMALSFGNSPGFALLGNTIPLALDPLLSFSFAIPGFVGTLPSEGYRSFSVSVASPVTPTTLYGAHIVVDLSTGTIPVVSPAVPFLLR